MGVHHINLLWSTERHRGWKTAVGSWQLETLTPSGDFMLLFHALLSLAHADALAAAPSGDGDPGAAQAGPVWTVEGNMLAEVPVLNVSALQPALAARVGAEHPFVSVSPCEVISGSATSAWLVLGNLEESLKDGRTRRDVVRARKKWWGPGRVAVLLPEVQPGETVSGRCLTRKGGPDLGLVEWTVHVEASPNGSIPATSMDFYRLNLERGRKAWADGNLYGTISFYGFAADPCFMLAAAAPHICQPFGTSQARP